MVGLLRSKMQGMGFRVIIWITLVVIAIAFTAPQGLHMLRSVHQDWILDVNGDTVSYQQFMRKHAIVSQQIHFIKQQYGQYADYILQMQGIAADPQLYAIDELTKNVLLDQAAQRIPINISEKYVLEKLADRMFMQSSGLAEVIPMELVTAQGTINERMLRQYLQRMGLSSAEFEQSIEDAFARFILMELVGISAYVPEFMLRDYYQQHFSNKKYSVLTWSIEDALKMVEKEAVIGDDLKLFYQEKADKNKKYWVPEKRGGVQWVFTPESYGISVSDSEVEKYYNRNKASYISTPVQIEVRRILFKIDSDAQEQDRYSLAKSVEDQLKNDPSLFASLAKQYSDDQETAKNGGLMPPFARGDQDKQFEQIAFLLKSDGDVSNIFKTSRGFEIIQRIGKKPAQYKSLKDVAGEIKKKLREDTFKQQFMADIQKLSKAPSNDELQRFIHKRGMVKKDTIVPTSENKLSNIHDFFRIQEGEVASFFEDGKGVLVQLATIEKRYLPAFELIQDEVKKDYYRQKARALIEKQSKEAKEEAQSSLFTDLQKKYGAAVLKNIGPLKLSEKTALDKLDKEGISSFYLSGLQKVGAAVIASGNGDRVSLIRLDAIEPVDDTAYKQEQEGIRKAIIQEEMMRCVQGFVASLHRTATIKINESIIAKVKDNAA